MKKIIYNRMYNTETAECLADWDNGLSRRDFNYLDEYLYRKKTGEYFLYGIGGPNTWCSQPVGEMFSGGEKIEPLTEQEAREWAERRLGADEYIEIFGEPEE